MNAGRQRDWRDCRSLWINPTLRYWLGIQGTQGCQDHWTLVWTAHPVDCSVNIPELDRLGQTPQCTCWWIAGKVHSSGPDLVCGNIRLIQKSSQRNGWLLRRQYIVEFHASFACEQSRASNFSVTQYSIILDEILTILPQAGGRFCLKRITTSCAHICTDKHMVQMKHSTLRLVYNTKFLIPGCHHCRLCHLHPNECLSIG